MASAAKTIEMQRREAPEVIDAPVEDFYIFDVETTEPAPEEVARMEADWLENWEPPANYKDAEKIAAYKAEQLAKWRERLALADEAPLAMIGVMFPEETMILHGVKKHAVKWLGKNGKRDRVSIEGFAGESRLIEATIQVLEARIRERALGVGHNIYGFDLPKLRLAAARNNLRLPDALRVKIHDEMERPQMLDTMHHFCRYFARSGQLFISAAEMQRKLGLPALLEGVADGKDVPRLLAAGKVEQVAIKLFADLVGCRDSFLRMTGRK